MYAIPLNRGKTTNEAQKVFFFFIIAEIALFELVKENFVMYFQSFKYTPNEFPSEVHVGKRS